jgi:hypothetical protein
LDWRLLNFQPDIFALYLFDKILCFNQDNLIKLKIAIYDCEIINCVPFHKFAKNQGLNYCSGWRDFKNMGISVIGCYLEGFNHFKNGFYSFANFENSIPFFCQNFQDIIDDQPLLVGFNSRKFDDALLKANNMLVHTDYDVLEEVRLASYSSRKWKKQPTAWSYNLDTIARANGMKKTGRSDLAPKLWQQGKQQQVIDYCLNDVFLTVEILRLGQEGKLIDPNTGKYLKLRDLKI